MARVTPWRLLCALTSFAIVAQAAILLSTNTMRGVASEIVAGDTLPLMIAGFGCFLAAIVHARQGWRAAAILGLAAASAGVLALYVSRVNDEGLDLGGLAIGRATWKATAFFAVVLPPALLFVRGARGRALVALGGTAVAALGIVLAAPRAVAFDDARGLVAVVPFLVGCALVAGALAREAWTPRAAPPRPLPRWAFAGIALLALAWGFGGSFLIIVPLWILAPVALAMPALARWRARPTAVVVAVALLAAGFLVPVGTCAYPTLDDVIRPDVPRSSDRVARLAEVAGHGPFWVRADLMGAGAVSCPAGTLAPAVLWLGALAAVAWLPWREPPSLVSRLARAPPVD